MSEEYEVLKAQKDELEKKMSNNPSCIDCVYYDTKKEVDLIVRRERARMRAAIANLVPSWGYGTAWLMREEVLELLEDGEADA
jgi:hypothetical protein